MINKKFTDLDGEVWVPLLRDYEISNMGRVVSNKGTYKRIMRTYLNNRDYHIVHLRINNRRIAYTVHRLVALIFVNNTDPNKVTVNHNFGKDDNRAQSLSWMTYSENCKHGVENGMFHRGSRHYKTTLDETQVRTIRSLRGEIKTKAIAGYFKISTGSVGHIFRRETWGHIK